MRHGVTAQTGTVLYGRTKGLELSEEGVEQARLMSEHLFSIHIDAIYSSPLERAFDTAQAIAKDRDLDVITRDELLDTHVGTWTNLTLAECALREEWKIVQEHPTQFAFPDGESFIDVLGRMNKVVNELVEKHVGENIVVTCHRDPIILLLGSYMGVHMDLFQRIPCKPASMSEVVFTNGVARVESVNVLPTQRMV